jgi:metal-responsive CopG/Arc/MetJ family transcriptional regulator
LSAKKEHRHIHISLPTALVWRIDKEAERIGETRSDLIAHVMRRHLMAQAYPSPRPGSKAALDALREEHKAQADAEAARPPWYLRLRDFLTGA